MIMHSVFWKVQFHRFQSSLLGYKRNRGKLIWLHLPILVFEFQKKTSLPNIYHMFEKCEKCKHNRWFSMLFLWWIFYDTVYLIYCWIWNNLSIFPAYTESIPLIWALPHFSTPSQTPTIFWRKFPLGIYIIGYKICIRGL
jgi:hypothetical protein